MTITSVGVGPATKKDHARSVTQSDDLKKNYRNSHRHPQQVWESFRTQEMESHGEGDEFGDLGVHHEQVGQAELRRVGRRRRRNSKMKRKK